MNELSYADALLAGIEPIRYRSGHLEALGEGKHPGTLDALVWCKRQPALEALITLDSGIQVMVVGYQRHIRRGMPPYLGFRAFSPGQRINLVIDRGPKGGLRPMLEALETTTEGV